MDDVLKSVPSVRDALTLIQEVRDLCKKGGFKLTKFISNKKDISFQIPDAFRRDGTKDMDLTGSLPIERALGIFWGIFSADDKTKHAFCYKFNI